MEDKTRRMQLRALLILCDEMLKKIGTVQFHLAIVPEIKKLKDDYNAVKKEVEATL